MSLSSLLTPQAADAPACPSRTVAPTRVREMVCCSDEAVRFGACTGVFVTVPIVSIDNGEAAAVAALTAFQTQT